MLIKGIAASSGISIGKVFKVKKEKIVTSNEKVENIQQEISKLEVALDISEKEIMIIRDKTARKIDRKHGAIFDAHIQILRDPELLNNTIGIIKNRKLNAGRALQITVDKFVKIFEEMDSEYMRERASDILDVSNRVLGHLLNQNINDPGLMEKEGIIVAQDLTPTDTASLDKDYVKGFATDKGGRTGHSGIMARTLEIPAVVGTKTIMENSSEGDDIIIDGEEGIVIINPNEEQLKEYRKKEKIYKDNKKR